MTQEKNCRPPGYYLNQIKESLPEGAFNRVPARILWLPFHLGIIISSIAVVTNFNLSWYFNLVCSIIIGHSYGCLMFVGHELMHGSILPQGRLRKLCAWICFLPYCMSPMQWFEWHNKWHHQKTSVAGFDPDSWGSLDTFNRRREFRLVEPLSPGSGCLRSIPFLGYWFFAQGLLVMFVFSKLFHYWDDVERKKIFVGIAGCYLFWITLAVLLGFQHFLYVYLAPMIFANILQMIYIATNHLLMPETREVNDPLINTLSVSTLRIIDFFHMNFSHHIEHHISPSMSPRFAPSVKKLLMEKFPGRYKCVPHWRALMMIYRVPKLHWDENHFVNPRSGEVFQAMDEDCSNSSIGHMNLPVPRHRKGSVVTDFILTPKVSLAKVVP